ncbi:MAG: hypothetical protein KDB27_13690 [Planctomycetales bacterium]|nr:hypothetical protein [Planctomycetales bacterium]
MSMTANQILDREYLELRAKILELAASFDRLDRAAEGGDSVASDDRMTKLAEGIKILQSSGQGRAERVQMLFSLPYSDTWRTDFRLNSK